MKLLMFALEGSGNYVEAERALDAYIDIIENEKKTLARMAKSSNPAADEDVIQEVDSNEDILRTMAAGVRILVKFLGKGKRAMEIAVKMDRDAAMWNVTNEDVLGQVWHSIGLANSLWSMQSATSPISKLTVAIEPDTRQAIQTTAITAYSKSIGYTPTLPTYFQLALQHAWQRNLDKSITSLSHALRLNKFHIPSIHLLTLLLTALEDYEKALQTCHTIKFDHLSDLSVDDAIALMEMQLTYLRIVEAVSGRDLTLEVQKGVFKLYNRLFGPVVRDTAYVKKEVVDFSSSGSLRRGRAGLGDALVGRGNAGTMHQTNDSVDSKTSSLQIPQQKTLRHQRSLLKRKPRSRSADGHSISTTSSVETPERRPDSSYPPADKV
jgi:hypothetical protein